MRRLMILIGLLILSILIILSPAQDNTAKVKHIQDGDTIAIEHGGGTEYVRMEGVNAPETDECYGSQATEQARYLIDSVVELQESNENRGHYGRLIRYVHAKDKDVGAELIENGYAQASGFDHPRYDDYKRLENVAKSNKHGLWKECRENMWEW